MLLEGYTVLLTRKGKYDLPMISYSRWLHFELVSKSIYEGVQYVMTTCPAINRKVKYV